MIKFIYFDVGGVLISDLLVNNKWIDMKRDLGITPAKDKDFDNFYDHYELKVCTGKNVDSLIPLIKSEFGLNFPKNYSFLQDFVNRFEKNETIWPVIKKAKSKYRIGLLTNMYPNMLDAIYKAGLMPDVEWNVTVDSSVEGVQKPDKKIFLLAQKKASVKSGEILFVENSRKHVDAAAKLGWNTFLYDPSNMQEASKKLDLYITSLKHKNTSLS